MIRKLVKVVLVLVVLVVIAIAAAFFYIDSIAKRAVEYAGTRVLGVPTTVDSMKIGVLTTSGSMHGLSVANPSGYADAKFMGLGEGALALDARSLMSDVVRVPTIRLSDLSLALEQKGLSESNARTILDYVKTSLPKGGGSTTGGSSGGRKFVIDELLITNITITAKSSGLPILQPNVNLKVPQIKLVSLGSGGKDPIGLDQLTAIVIDAVMKAALEAGAGQLPQQLVDGIFGGLAGLGGTLPDFDLKVDLGQGFKDLGTIGELAGKLGVDLGSLGDALGKEATGGLGEVGKKIEDATKGAGDSIKKGIDDLIKK